MIDEIEVASDPYQFEPLTEAEREVLDQLLSPAQVTRLLGLSRQRVDQLMGGSLPVVWIGDPPRRFVMRRHAARYAEVEELPRPASRRRWKRPNTSQAPASGA